jgi:hypothetical protein
VRTEPIAQVADQVGAGGKAIQRAALGLEDRAHHFGLGVQSDFAAAGLKVRPLTLAAASVHSQATSTPLALARASTIASARSIPRLAPVTIATLLSKRFF